MCRQRTFFATTVTAGWLRDGSQQSTLLPAVSRNGAVGFHALHRRATCANSGRSFSTAVTAGRLANVTRPERRWSGAVDRAFAGWCTGAIRCSRKPLTSSRAPTPGGVLSCVCCWKHGIGCAPVAHRGTKEHKSQVWCYSKSQSRWPYPQVDRRSAG